LIRQVRQIHAEVPMLWFNAASSRRGAGVAGKERFQRRTRRAFLGADATAVETLEDRQLLSVSASTLAGRAAVAGTVSTYETLSGKTIILKETQTVLGPATFDGQHVVDTEEIGGPPGGSTTATTHSFATINGAGWLVYGTTGTTQTGGNQSSDMTTNSPPEVVLPGTMVVGTPYTEHTTATEQVTSPNEITSIVTQSSTVLTLEAGKHSVKVPAGRFLAYVVDETITTSTSTTINVSGTPITATSGPTTNTAKEYYAPKVGLVEYAIGALDNVELVGRGHKAEGTQGNRKLLRIEGHSMREAAVSGARKPAPALASTPRPKP
jgi:hypothetical protein